MGFIYFTTHVMQADFEPKLCELYRQYLEGNGEAGVSYPNGCISFDAVVGIVLGEPPLNPSKKLQVLFRNYEKPFHFAVGEEIPGSNTFESWQRQVNGEKPAFISYTRSAYRFVLDPKQIVFAQLSETPREEYVEEL